jgi:hypothetical protein
MRNPHDRYLFRLWLARWGFAVMVAAAIVVGFVVATTVSPPTEVPSLALRAVAVYRVEVGAAVFFGLYVATMAFALALQNRGFTEIGGGGIRAQDLTAVSEDAVVEDVAAELLAELFEEMEALQIQRERMQGVYRAAH